MSETWDGVQKAMGDQGRSADKRDDSFAPSPTVHVTVCFSGALVHSPVHVAGWVRKKTGGNGLTIRIQPDDPACPRRLQLFQVPLGQQPGERALGLLETAMHLLFHHPPASHAFDRIDGPRIPQEIAEDLLDRVPRRIWIDGMHTERAADDVPGRDTWRI